MVDTKIPITITRTTESRLTKTNFNDIPFGKVYTDHMFLANYENGEWGNFRIVPFGNISISPCSTALHYGQAIFEGMKAYRSSSNPEEILYFRPDMNFQRLNRSAQRMAIPEIPENIFFGALDALINIDREWVPYLPGCSLYIRPLVFGSDEFIGVRASQKYIFALIISPTSTYYSEPTRVKIETSYTRAVSGGTGFAKAAGNYAACLYPAKMGNQQGYHQLVWTDAKEHKYIEEAGTMNIMAVINNTLITPALSDTILAGVTRDSVLQIARSQGVKVEERPLGVDELLEAHANGTLTEAFGVGTAATVSHIRLFGYNGKDYELPAIETRKICLAIQKELDDIRYGRIPDTRSWTRKLNA